MSTVFPVRVRVASAGVRVCVNGVIDDFLTDPLSEITRSSRAPLGCRRERRTEAETETDRDGAETRECATLARHCSCRDAVLVVFATIQKAANSSTPPSPTALLSSSSSSYSRGKNIGAGFMVFRSAAPVVSTQECTDLLTCVCACVCERGVCVFVCV